jgi:hypothetical protein
MITATELPGSSIIEASDQTRVRVGNPPSNLASLINSVFLASSRYPSLPLLVHGRPQAFTCSLWSRISQFHPLRARCCYHSPSPQMSS